MIRHTKNKYLIVGATSDVGQAIAIKLTNQGASLSLFGRNKEKLDSLRKDLYKNSKSDVSIQVVDLFDQVQMKDAVKEESLKKKFNGLVYCAGYHNLLGTRSISREELNKFNHLNNTAFIEVFKETLSRKNSDTTRTRPVVAIASISHLLGEIGLAGYSGSKAALVAIARSLAMEFSNKDIRVNTISPGWLVSKTSENVKKRISKEAYEKIKSSYPLGFGNPEDVSNLASFLLSSESRWITGQDIIIDGGRTIQ